MYESSWEPSRLSPALASFPEIARERIAIRTEFRDLRPPARPPPADARFVVKCARSLLIGNKVFKWWRSFLIRVIERGAPPPKYRRLPSSSATVKREREVPRVLYITVLLPQLFYRNVAKEGFCGLDASSRALRTCAGRNVSWILKCIRSCMLNTLLPPAKGRGATARFRRSGGLLQRSPRRALRLEIYRPSSRAGICGYSAKCGERNERVTKWMRRGSKKRSCIHTFVSRSSYNL